MSLTTSIPATISVDRQILLFKNLNQKIQFDKIFFKHVTEFLKREKMDEIIIDAIYAVA